MKKWYKSKTIWLNVISFLLELIQLLSGYNFIPTGVLTLVSNSLNVALRFITNTEINVIKRKDEKNE